MSGGEQQMLTIARTLMGNPRCVLLDEPSEGLAPIIVEQMAQSIRALKGEGLSVLLCEQNLHFCEASPTAPISSRRARSASAARWPSSPPTPPSANSIFRFDHALARTSLTVGIDVGGTFTDLLAIDSAHRRGQARQGADHGRQPGDRLHGRARRGRRRSRRRCRPIVHGTTTTTNALLERKIAKVGLITTKGFRDVLELGRRTRPQPYGLRGTFRPLIERELRLEVPERMDADGKVLTPLDEAAVAEAAKKLLALGCEARRHPFPAQLHQPGARAARRRDRARRCGPTPTSRAGHAILSEYREFERGVTAAVNASVQPVLDRYLDAAAHASSTAKGFDRDILVMQGNGGTISSQLDRARPR